MTSSATDLLFDAREWLRYSRHIQLPQLGASGQTQLKQARVLVIGCGGLGSPVLLYLAAAGIGQLTLVDGDCVDLSNLQRQVLFQESDLGLPKAEVACQRLGHLNSSIKLRAIDHFFTADIAVDLIKDHDLIVDCTDNFESRYLINDLCVQWAKPWVFASVYQFSGQCALFVPGGPCFRCLFPDTPEDVPDCNAAGVLGVLPGMLGTLQACEAIKYLTGLPTPLSSHLLLVEALDVEFRRIQLRANPQCQSCGAGRVELPFSPVDSAVEPDDVGESSDLLNQLDEPMLISPEQFNKHRDSKTNLILDVRSIEERQAFHIGGEHLALAELAKAALHLPRDGVIICYCQSGSRSLEAAQRLQNAGFTAYSLAGGLAQWLRHSEL